MATEQEQDRLNQQFQGDIIDIKVRLGVAESDIKIIKIDLGTIKSGISKLLWGVFGIFGTLATGLVVTIVAWFLNKH